MNNNFDLSPKIKNAIRNGYTLTKEEIRKIFEFFMFGTDDLTIEYGNRSSILNRMETVNFLSNMFTKNQIKGLMIIDALRDKYIGRFLNDYYDDIKYECFVNACCEKN